jgi:hypothetical protein
LWECRTRVFQKGELSVRQVGKKPLFVQRRATARISLQCLHPPVGRDLFVCLFFGGLIITVKVIQVTSVRHIVSEIVLIIVGVNII